MSNYGNFIIGRNTLVVIISRRGQVDENETNIFYPVHPEDPRTDPRRPDNHRTDHRKVPDDPWDHAGVLGDETPVGVCFCPTDES